MNVPLMTMDAPNSNGRIYPRSVMEKALAKYKSDFVDTNRAFIVKHIPESETVNLLDAVGLVKEIKIEGDKIIANAQFFESPDGLIMKTAVKDEYLHVRTSGIGTTTKQPDGTYKVNDDYQITCCFLTNDPAKW